MTFRNSSTRLSKFSAGSRAVGFFSRREPIESTTSVVAPFHCSRRTLFSGIALCFPLGLLLGCTVPFQPGCQRQLLHESIAVEEHQMSLSSVGSDKAETVWWQAGLFSVQTGTYSDVLVASVQLEYPEGLHRALIGFERHANQAAVRFSLEVRDRGGTDCVRAHTSNIDSWDYLLDEESDPCAGDVLRVELRLGSDGPCPSAADDGFLVSLIAEDSSGWRVTLEQVEIRVPVGNPQGLLESALHDQGVQLRRTLGAACLQQVQTHNAELRRDSGEELCVGVFEYRDAISESCENAWEGTVLVIGAGPERMCCVLELSNASEEELVSIARKAELPVTIREP